MKKSILGIFNYFCKKYIACKCKVILINKQKRCCLLRNTKSSVEKNENLHFVVVLYNMIECFTRHIDRFQHSD